jgi:hypothetical protein
MADSLFQMSRFEQSNRKQWIIPKQSKTPKKSYPIQTSLLYVIINAGRPDPIIPETTSSEFTISPGRPHPPFHRGLTLRQASRGHSGQAQEDPHAACCQQIKLLLKRSLLLLGFHRSATQWVRLLHEIAVQRSQHQNRGAQGSCR